MHKKALIDEKINYYFFGFLQGSLKILMLHFVWGVTKKQPVQGNRVNYIFFVDFSRTPSTGFIRKLSLILIEIT